MLEPRSFLNFVRLGARRMPRYHLPTHLPGCLPIYAPERLVGSIAIPEAPIYRAPCTVDPDLAWCRYPDDANTPDPMCNYSPVVACLHMRTPESS